MRSGLRSRGHIGRISIALVLSYVFDWIVIIAAAGVGAVLADITPNMRPFSLIDPDISHPFVVKEKVPTWTLGVIALAGPALIIFLVTLILVPGPTVSKNTPKSLIWQRKLWEWHTGWLGLALSLASSFLITQGMKNLFGKPRPDLLSRCQPDMANVYNYATGALNASVAGLPVLVSAAICQNKDKHILDDGFRSYPSGHASFASGGLVYLSIYLCSKLGIFMPYLSPRNYSSNDTRLSAFPSRAERRTDTGSSSNTIGLRAQDDPTTAHDDAIVAARNEAAAPPVYLMAIAIIPWFASIYIAGTRWSDFRHHGFDILFGYSIGLITSFFAFRYYHLPIRQGAGWSWGPRSSSRSFWAGIGVGNYAGSGSRVVEGALNKNPDLEAGTMGPPMRRGTNDVGSAGTKDI